MIGARALVIGTLAVWAALWVGFDLYYWATGRQTITRYVQSVSARYPAIPLSVGLVIGLILGHFFFQF